MNFKEWRSLWRFDREIDVPHASVVVMCPYVFARILWYSTSKEFKAWPATWDTGIVLGWRWPWRKEFREKAWIRRDEMPLAVYSAMDQTYLARATKDFGLEPSTSTFKPEPYFATKAALTIKETIESAPCPHDRPGQARYWVASCESCARKALLKAIAVRGQYDGRGDVRAHESKRLKDTAIERERVLVRHDTEIFLGGGVEIPDPNESPLAAFREKEAKKRLGDSQ